MKTFPLLPLQLGRRNEKESRKNEMLWSFFPYKKLLNIKTVKNKMCTAPCAVVQPVVTTKGQVLLVKAVSNSRTFS